MYMMCSLQMSFLKGMKASRTWWPFQKYTVKRLCNGKLAQLFLKLLAISHFLRSDPEVYTYHSFLYKVLYSLHIPHGTGLHRQHPLLSFFFVCNFQQYFTTYAKFSCICHFYTVIFLTLEFFSSRLVMLKFKKHGYEMLCKRLSMMKSIKCSSTKVMMSSGTASSLRSNLEKPHNII